MKRLLLIIITFFAGLAPALAQPASTTAFNIGGIKVIFKPTLKNVINVRMYYRGGVTNYQANQAGIEDMALYAATDCGTKKYTAGAFRDTADKYDISIYGRSYYDYGYIELNCITKYFNNGWDLFTEAITNPVFDAGEVARLKANTITSVNRNRSYPESKLRQLQMQTIFANTAYTTDPSGTEQTLTGLTPDDLKSYYNTLLNKNKLFIVVVGNITKEELYEKILLSFDNIKSQPYFPPPMTAPVWDDNKLTSLEQDLKINYVCATMNAPEYTSIDYVPFRIAISGLGGNLYQELRVRQSLAFNPTTNVIAFKMPFATMAASTTNPQQLITGMAEVLKNIQRRGYNDEWLQHIKNSYITDSYINDQSASQITSNLGIAEILGNWHYADNLPQLVKMVTVDQVNRVINTYIKGLKWNYLGKTNAIEGFTPPAN